MSGATNAKFSGTGGEITGPAWTKRLTLVDGPTITMDCSLSNAFRVTLAGNRTLNVINLEDGQCVEIYVFQDATGGRTLTVNNSETPGGLAAVLSTAANSKDILTGSGDGTNWAFAIRESYSSMFAMMPHTQINRPYAEKAFDYDGVDEHVRFTATNGTGPIAANGALEVWFRQDDAGDGYLANRIRSGGGFAGEWRLLSNNLAIQFRIDQPTNVNINGNSNITQSVWNHILVNWQAMEMFINGVLQTDTDTSAVGLQSIGGTTDFLAVGMNVAVGDDAILGPMTQMSIWNTAPLSSSEVAALYNNGRPTNPRKNFGNYTSSTDLIHHWVFGDNNDTVASNGVKDLVGSIHGTAINMEASDIVIDNPGG